MPKFLNTEEIYRILQRELPENVYPDGAPSAFFSTAENHAVADAASGVYTALEQVYQNFFPQSANEQIDEWEVKVFGATTALAFTLQQRRDRIISQLRSSLSISLWDILVVINSYVPIGTFTQILEWGTATDEWWILDVSELDLGTVLGGGNPSLYYGSNACAQSQADYLAGGALQQQVIDARKQAYFYEVRIYDYTLASDTLADMIATIKSLHPVRSDFEVFQNISLASSDYQVAVTDVDASKNIAMIARDLSSATSFIGRIKGP